MTTSARDARLGNPDWADNWTVGAGLRMEIMDEQTSDVWLGQEPISEAQALSLSLPSGFALSGLAGSVADLAWFSRSPGDECDGPLATMEVDGRRFARVARPLERDRTITDAIVLRVDKHHSVLFRSGRTIDVVELGGGRCLVPAWVPGGRSADRDELELPSDWSRHRVDLAADLLVQIPQPATVLIGKDGSGFHGPVSDLQLATTSPSSA